MADYLPKFVGGTYTASASAAIAGGVIVAVSGSNTVATAGAKAAGWVGVSGQAAAASGDRIPVHYGGIQSVVNSGGVTAGDVLVTAANGAVATLAAVTATGTASATTATDITDTRAVVGVALTTAADGAAVLVKFER